MGCGCPFAFAFAFPRASSPHVPQLPFPPPSLARGTADAGREGAFGVGIPGIFLPFLLSFSCFLPSSLLLCSDRHSAFGLDAAERGAHEDAAQFTRHAVRLASGVLHLPLRVCLCVYACCTYICTYVYMCTGMYVFCVWCMYMLYI